MDCHSGTNGVLDDDEKALWREIHGLRGQRSGGHVRDVEISSRRCIVRRYSRR